MKKILAITMTLALLLSVGLATPAMANGNGTTLPGEVIANPGEGPAPTIVVKWETPDEDILTPGTQINPPMSYGGNRTVKYWAVVTHPYGKENVQAVYVDVYYPDIIGTDKEWCGKHKYQLKLEKVDKFGVGKPAFIAAWEDGTITEECLNINPDTDAPYTYDEIIYELDECSADVYMVEGILHYHQPAGGYTVRIKAVPISGENAYLFNTMTYLEGLGFEIDFNSIVYGSVTPGIWKQLDGNKDFRTPPGPFSGTGAGPEAERGTVRNIGNVDLRLTIHNTDLVGADGNPLGKTGEDWNVTYGSRLGSAADGYERQEHDPCQTITLNKVLPLCNTDKLDLWIRINKLGTSGSWTNQFTIGCVVVPFAQCGS